MRVLLVRPTASGGLAAHVDQELALLESTGRRVAEAPVRIRERPSPRHDAATVTALRRIVRGGADDTTLRDAIREAILQKPAAHCFAQQENITEHKSMNQIGG